MKSEIGRTKSSAPDVAKSSTANKAETDTLLPFTSTRDRTSARLVGKRLKVLLLLPCVCHREAELSRRDVVDSYKARC